MFVHIIYPRKIFNSDLIPFLTLHLDSGTTHYQLNTSSLQSLMFLEVKNFVTSSNLEIYFYHAAQTTDDPEIDT